MSSSTSSSERGDMNAETAAPGQVDRKVNAKIFLAMTLGMGMALLGIRLLLWTNDASGDTILGRVQEARAALPRIVAEEEDLVMFYGSSMVDAGFSARRFDRRLTERGAELMSFNFGFGGLNPYFQDFLARRIRDEFEGADRRLALAMIEFNPFQNTAARWKGAQPVVDSFGAMLASPQEMWEITRRDPARGIHMLNIHYLRDDISAEMITWEFGGFLRPGRPRSEIPEDEAANERLREVGQGLTEKFEAEYPDFTGEDWYYPWQGAGTIPEERSPETLELFKEYYTLRRGERNLENDRLNRIHCCDILDLHFEDELVAAFIRTVKVFQEFSDRVEVVMLPRNTDWIENPPEARERLRLVLERIRVETGLTVRDHQDLPEINPEMFSDTTHLARYSGDVAYTDFLAREYGFLLGAAPVVDSPGGHREAEGAAGEDHGGDATEDKETN